MPVSTSYFDFFGTDLVFFFAESDFLPGFLAPGLAAPADFAWAGFSEVLIASVVGFRGSAGFGVDFGFAESTFSGVDPAGATGFGEAALATVAEPDFFGTGFPVGFGEALSVCGFSVFSAGSALATGFSVLELEVAFVIFAEVALELDLPDFFGSSLALTFGGFNMAS